MLAPLQVALIVGAVVGASSPSGTSSLNGWMWTIENKAPPPSEGASWRTTERPWVRVEGGRRAVVWFKRAIPAFDPTTDVSLLVGYQSSPFDIFVGNTIVYHYAGSAAHSPWHLVPLPAEAGGRDLFLRVEDSPTRHGYIGFAYGLRMGSRADHYLGMVRDEWVAGLLSLSFLVVALVALGGQFMAFARREDRPYAALAALCAATGWAQVQEYSGQLAALIWPRQDLLEATSFMCSCLIPAAEAWYVRRVFGRRLRFGLMPAVVAFGIFGLVMGSRRISGAFPFPYESRCFDYFAAVASVLTLMNLGVGWRANSSALKVVGMGLLVNEAVNFSDLMHGMLGLYGSGIRITEAGFFAFLIFLMVSAILVGLEIRKKEEAAREKNARLHAVAQTTAMFAHDVRKPFSLVRATLQSLRSSTSLVEVLDGLDIAAVEVEEVTRSVESMIGDIMEAGSEAPPQTGAEDLSSMLAEVLATFGRLGEGYEVELQYELRHSRALLVHRGRMVRVFTNIVGNALQAMRGPGRIWFKSRDLEKRGALFVEVVIGNSGSFIPPENLPRLFEPFFTSGKKSGTGLGLAIVKKAVEAHGGTVSCASSQAMGVEFTVTLPAGKVAALSRDPLPEALRPRPKHTPKPEPIIAPASATVGSGIGQVVLVEDSRSMRRAWKRRFPEGALREFQSPSVCLQAVEADPSVIEGALYVILDNRFQTGEMGGLELAEVLRPRTTAPILLCSGVAEDPLPPCFDGQLSKDAHDLESLAQAVRRSSRRCPS